MSQRLQHALHNEKVSKYLKVKPEYLDWIVTTSFYSALHFVEHFIFPFNHTENGQTIQLKNIGDYKRWKKNLKSKHELRTDLVIWKCPEIEVPYRWLHDTANNARYYDYKVLNASLTLGLADLYLKTIKTHCTAKPNLGKS